MYTDEYLKKIFRSYPRLMEKMDVDGFIPIMPSEEHEGGVAIRIEREGFSGEITVILNPLDYFDLAIYDYDSQPNDKPIMTVPNVHIDSLIPMVYELFRRTIDSKKIKMNEGKITKLITEELKKSDIIDIVKKDKDFENRIKEIVREIIKDMFRVLWQHNDIFKSLGR